MGYCYSKFVDERTCNGAQLSSKQMMKQFCCCSAPDGSAWQDDSNEACEACPVMQTGFVFFVHKKIVMYYLLSPTFYQIVKKINIFRT